MNGPRAWIALGLALVLVGLSGCNNAKNGPSSITPAQANPVVQAGMESVFLPLVTVLAALKSVSPASQPAVGAPRGATCEPVGDCSGGGTYQVCGTGATFTACTEGGRVIDGTVTVTNPLLQTVEFDLDISGTSVVGPAKYQPGTCDTWNLDEVTGSTPDVTATVDGRVDACPAVQGELRSTVQASGVTADVVLTFDGGSEVDAIVSDPSSGDTVAICTVTLVQCSGLPPICEPTVDTSCTPY